MKEKDLNDYLPKLKTWCGSKTELKRFWVYGSRVKGTATEDSDIDLAFEIHKLKSDIEKTEFREKHYRFGKKNLKHCCRGKYI